MVGSPRPLAIQEQSTICALIDRGTIVVACGGGGIPSYVDERGALEGVDAVVDKDSAAATLAAGLNAELFMILTDVDAVYADWGTPRKRALPRLTLAQIAEMNTAHAFGEGSMAPKVLAAAEYVHRTGGRAIITELARGSDAVAGRVGTTIVPS